MNRVYPSAAARSTSLNGEPCRGPARAVSCTCRWRAWSLSTSTKRVMARGASHESQCVIQGQACSRNLKEFRAERGATPVNVNLPSAESGLRVWPCRKRAVALFRLALAKAVRAPRAARSGLGGSNPAWAADPGATKTKTTTNSRARRNGDIPGRPNFRARARNSFWIS
jgi:hypothetical protein